VSCTGISDICFLCTKEGKRGFAVLKILQTDNNTTRAATFIVFMPVWVRCVGVVAMMMMMMVDGPTVSARCVLSLDAVIGRPWQLKRENDRDYDCNMVSQTYAWYK
jgi:hypothetical protein